MPGGTSTASCAGAPSVAGGWWRSGWRWPALSWSVAAWSAAPGPTIAGTAALAAAHDRLLAQALSDHDLVVEVEVDLPGGLVLPVQEMHIEVAVGGHLRD